MTPEVPEREHARRFDSAEQEAYLGLWRTYDRLRELEDALFAEWEITNQQYNVLRLLEGAHPAALPTQIVLKKLVSRAPDATRMLDRLVERKLIRRERAAEDRRAYHLGITEAGIALLKRIAAPLRACHAAQLGHLSGAQLNALSELLQAAREPHEPDDSPWK
jgi:DNA-binding MarR family transcriptional regulator